MQIRAMVSRKNIGMIKSIYAPTVRAAKEALESFGFKVHPIIGGQIFFFDNPARPTWPGKNEGLLFQL